MKTLDGHSQNSQKNEYTADLNNKQSSQQVLDACYNTSIVFLSNALETLFNSCDDLFFDLSSRATSNNEQNIYFESMRELRIQKVSVINRFIKSMETSLKSLNNSEALKAAIEQQYSETATATMLSLVQDDQVEKNVAITGMVTRTRSNNQEYLYHLNKRFNFLCPHLEITQENNPIDPKNISDIFADACEDFDIHIKSKIIIYKQFERLVLNQASRLYNNLNEILINAGVLPNISFESKGSATSSNAKVDNQTKEPAKQETQTVDQTLEKTIANNAASNTPQAQNTIDPIELNILLNKVRLNPNTEAASNLNLINISNNGKNDAVTQDELISALASASTLTNSSHPLAHEDLRNLVRLAFDQLDTKNDKTFKKADEDTINLIALFFDFVLDDENLPIAYRALISRLQIPVLKIALADNSLLVNEQHPAREFINLVASIGVSSDIDALSQDKLFQQIQAAVQDIIENYDSSEVLTKNLSEIQKAYEQQEHRRKLIETRTKQAAHGQAITSMAQEKTQERLYNALAETSLPAEVTDFIVNHWQAYIKICFIKFGKESKQSEQSLNIVEHIIEYCNCYNNSHADYNYSFAELSEKIGQPLLLGLSQTLSSQTESEQVLEDIMTCLESYENTDISSICSSLLPKHAVALGHVPGSGSKGWKEMTCHERQEAQYKALSYESIKKCDGMLPGTWVIYDLVDKGKTIRCKLATRIKETNSLIFVNRLGFKILEKSRKEFALDIQNKIARPIASRPFFERTFSLVHERLRTVSAS